MQDPVEPSARGIPGGASVDRPAVILTALAALMPTLLSAQGMISVGIDVLRLAAAVAVALAVFLELALVSSALLARSAVRQGRSGSGDLTATWVFSTVSGCFSAAHELVGPADPLGLRTWQLDARAGLAAGVRIAAPLVAAWLWHRILTGDRHDTDGAPTRREARRNRLMHGVATAALDMKRAQQHRPNSLRTLRARRRLDRCHRTLLRHVPATDTQLPGQLQRWLTEIGRVDHLVFAVALPAHQGGDVDLPAKLEAVQTDSAVNAAVDDSAARLAVAVSLIADSSGPVSGHDVAAAFRQRGWPATPRTGQRWLARARTELGSA